MVGIVPAVASKASISVVFPQCEWPTKARLRISLPRYVFMPVLQSRNTGEGFTCGKTRMVRPFRGLEPHLLRERLFPPAASATRYHLAHFLTAKAAHPADRNQFPLETCIECRRKPSHTRPFRPALRRTTESSIAASTTASRGH